MKQHSYSYPLDLEWTTAEITVAISFFNAVEDAYEKTVNRQLLLSRYDDFCQVAGSKMAVKQLERQFAAVSGYQAYPVVKAARNSTKKTIKMVGD